MKLRLLSIVLLLTLSPLKAQKVIMLRDNIVSYSFLSPEDSVKQSKTVYVYYESGSCRLRTRYRWEEKAVKWIGISKTAYKYDSVSQVIQKSHYRWDNDQWNNISLKNSRYDYEGNVSAHAGYRWDEEEGRWRWVARCPR